MTTSQTATPRIWTISSLIVVLVLGSAADCGKSSSGGANQCDTRVEPPIYENLAGKDAIVARGSSSCDKAPATHFASLTLDGIPDDIKLIYEYGDRIIDLH